MTEKKKRFYVPVCYALPSEVEVMAETAEEAMAIAANRCALTNDGSRQDTIAVYDPALEFMLRQNLGLWSVDFDEFRRQQAEAEGLADEPDLVYEIIQ